jgi:hypothetical protein
MVQRPKHNRFGRKRNASSNAIRIRIGYAFFIRIQNEDPWLARSSAVPVFSIERINTRRARSGEVITPDGELRIEGWAFDGSAKRSAGGVEVLIDGIPQPASYGLERPQQARIPSCSACEHAGFVADFSAAGLSPGSHVLGIRVISSDGASYSEANWGSITIGK